MRLLLRTVLFLLLPLLLGAAADWKEIDRLISEQKLEEASRATQARLDEAKRAGNGEEWTRALIQLTQLRTGLHGYETAVRQLREEPWPEEPVQRTALRLFLSRALVHYGQAYGWEIRQRERVESTGPVDLKAWTIEQIHEAASAAYLESWKEREALGKTPVRALSRWVQPNDYPDGIRSTLRDALTYLWVEQLADQAGWRPEHAAETFRLDLRALLAKPPAVNLDDPAVHPLEKTASILAELEAWHRREGRREAALEAHLERARRLHEGFRDPGDREVIRRHLLQSLRGLEALPWWSMGAETLVTMQLEAELRVEARELASRCAARHPRHVGGQRCLFQQAQIESPGFSLTSMAADGAGKRSIEVRHRNLEKLYFRAVRVDLEKRIAGARDWNKLPHGEELARLLRGGKPDASWTVELPPTPDYAFHRTFVTPPLQKPGLWVVGASAGQDFAGGRNQLQALNLVITDLVLVTRGEAGSTEVSVVSGSTGRPVADVEVALYRTDWRGPRHVLDDEEQTGADGTVRFEARREGGFFLVARKGGDVAWAGDLPFQHEPADRNTQGSLVYTDRSVYRPGQQIRWKVVAYEGRAAAARWEVLDGEELDVALVDANGERVATTKVETNRWGSASGSFEVPVGRLLGGWRIVAGNGQAAIRVEEYKRPTFEATLSAPKGEVRLNGPVSLHGEARYLFGAPVAAGRISWRVTREPLYPDWWWWGRQPAQVIASGSDPIGPEGAFEVRFTPEAKEPTRPEERSVVFRYRLAVDVTDEGGETAAVERSLLLGWSSVAPRIEVAQGFLPERTATKVAIHRVGLEGAPLPGAGSWNLVRLVQPEETPLPADLPLEKGLTEGDGLRPRWETNLSPDAWLRLQVEGKSVAHGKIEHGADGVANVDVPALEPGVYRLRYETLDSRGRKAEAQRELVVAGGRIAVPLLLAAETTEVPVGGRARFLVASGLADGEVVVDVHRAGKRILRRRLRGGGSLEVPVREADRGGFVVTAILVRDHQLLQQSRTIAVPWDDRQLKLSFSTFRDRVRPGDRETWKVKVEGAPAELLAYAYDRALDAFAPHHPASPLSLLPSRATGPWIRSSLGAESARFSQGGPVLPHYPQLRGDMLLFPSGYGIGGLGSRGVYGMTRRKAVMDMADAPTEGEMAAEAAAPPPAAQRNERADTRQPAQPIRENFAETAFWLPHLQPRKGEAEISFTVPDSVTTWNVWVHAVSPELHGGSVTRISRSAKELLVRPYLPRFLREGDRAELVAVINNTSDRALAGEVDLRLEDPATGADLLAAFGVERSRFAFEAPAKGSARIAIPVVAPRKVGPVAVRIEATTGELSDGERRLLPVLPGRMHLIESLFATLRPGEPRTLGFELGEDPTRIDEALVVTVDAQLFHGVIAALPHLLEPTFESSDAIANRVLAAGMLAAIYERHPKVAKMARKSSGRATPLEAWDGDDANRKMALEESPWLEVSRGGKGKGVDLLDPEKAEDERDASMERLASMQTSIGGFPWFPGGPPSPYITLDVLLTLAWAAERGVEVPQPMLEAAWDYLARHYREAWTGQHRPVELLTLLNYVASLQPEATALTAAERNEILAISFAHWKRHAPRLKCLLALTLNRNGRSADARLVFESVMDSAKTEPELGTYWAPEDRAWLWYNDTTESHAVALRTLLELMPKDERRHGLVQWLFLDKKLNQWKSTRATAEVIGALSNYLEREGAMGAREEIRISAGSVHQALVFEPEVFTGKGNQVVIEAPTADHARVEVVKEGPGLAFASATWHYSTEKLPAEEKGDLFFVSRKYFRRIKTGRETTLRPLAEGEKLAVGDEVEVQLSIRARHAAEYVHLRDPRPAGLEPGAVVSRHRWDLGLAWYEETRDSGTGFFFEWLPAGEYTLKHRLRVATAGTFRAAPAQLQSLYAPEFAARSAGAEVRIEQ